MLGDAPYEVRLYAASERVVQPVNCTDFFGISEVGRRPLDEPRSLIAGLPTSMSAAQLGGGPAWPALAARVSERGLVYGSAPRISASRWPSTSRRSANDSAVTSGRARSRKISAWRSSASPSAVVEIGQLRLAGGGEPARQEAQPLVRARLDERRDQERVEQPLRLAPPHLLHQPAGVLVGKIGAWRPPPPSQQRRHLHDVAGLLVRQPRQLRRPRRPGADSAAPATARSRPPSARSAGDPTAAPADRPRWPRTSAGACRSGECWPWSDGAEAYQTSASSAAMAAPSV